MPQSDRAQALAARELANAARAAGCRVLAESTLVDGDRIWPVFRLECGDNAHAIRFLDRAATLDAGDASLRDLALRLRRAHPAVIDSRARFSTSSRAPCVSCVSRAKRFSTRSTRFDDEQAIATITHAR